MYIAMVDNHRTVRCPLNGCNFAGKNLRRHLLSGKHKDNVDASTVNVLVQMIRKGNNARRAANRHRTVRCPLNGCNFAGKNLKRHLLSGKHKDNVDASIVNVLVQMVLKGNNTGWAETPMRWCPVSGCHKLVTWLRLHFYRAHGITDHRLLDDLMEGSQLY